MSNFVERKLQFISKWSNGASIIATFIIFASTFANIISRYLGYPLEGAYDISSLAFVVATFFAIPRVQLKRQNVEVEVFVDRLPRKVQTILGVTTTFLCLVFVGVLSWQFFVYAQEVKKSHEILPSLHVSYWWMVCIAGLASMSLFVIFAAQLFNYLRPEGMKR